MWSSFPRRAISPAGICVGGQTAPESSPDVRLHGTGPARIGTRAVVRSMRPRARKRATTSLAACECHVRLVENSVGRSGEPDICAETESEDSLMTENDRLNNSTVALITGGIVGSVSAFAHALRARGASVVIGTRSAEGVDVPGARVIPLNVTDAGSVGRRPSAGPGARHHAVDQQRWRPPADRYRSARPA